MESVEKIEVPSTRLEGFTGAEWADIMAASDERGITPMELVHRAVLEDLAR